MVASKFLLINFSKPTIKTIKCFKFFFSGDNNDDSKGVFTTLFNIYGGEFAQNNPAFVKNPEVAVL